jgi:hypothetical protein
MAQRSAGPTSHPRTIHTCSYAGIAQTCSVVAMYGRCLLRGGDVFLEHDELPIS